MATILLSAAGQAVGALFGPVGAIAGRALGAVAGAMIDGALIRASEPTRQGPRLSDLSIQTSTEGQSIPRIYGRIRLSGAIIWATHYEEDAIRERSGGKGGPTVQTYKYFANFAVALCEGPVHRLSRVWADGVELDLSTVQLRFYTGTGDQPADSLISARQAGGVPAYRDLAYVVFERLPLADYGNRIPQLAFEVIRVVDTLESKIRALTLIPGATEFGYSKTPVTTTSSGSTTGENRHTRAATSDLMASLDEAQDLCPNLERIALVIAWFGNDLRAGSCRLTPRVETATKTTSRSWSVAGLDRSSAGTVTLVAGTPAFGGTPDDASVVAAITEIKARGLKVTLYPFILMDIPAGNGLPDPYGAAEQAANPWRGRITCHPAPGRAGSPDKTAAASTQVAAFVGTALASQFTIAGDTVTYSGPVDWGFRRMVLHYAHLAVAAGGVDAFLLGSELRGLTTVRASSAGYPFVDALVTLAADVKAIVGSATLVTYGADWTEWFGHQPADDSGDVYFHLDPLWASPHVGMIGIDSYVPLSDWRYGDHLDAGIAESPWDLEYLRGNLLAGEGYDWFYASAAARREQVRSAISDGAYGEPWVFRFKDVPAWWQNRHYNRPGGVRSSSPTAWVPRSKPIWFTETGCPAVDLGANQPNMFPDPASSEGGLPWFSRGARDDLAQRRYCEAVLSAWDPDDPAHLPAALLTTTSGGPMIEPSAIHLWTWDARPFPAFPAYSDVWADSSHWRTGHWLTGRLGGTGMEALLRAILADFAVSGVVCTAISGHVDGYIIDSTMTARAALEPLLAAWQIDAIDTGAGLGFAGRGRRPVRALVESDLIDPDKSQILELRRTQEIDLPHEVSITVSDALREQRRTTVTSRRLAGASARATRADLPVAVALDVALGLADQWLHDLWIGREQVAFALPPQDVTVEPGDVITVPIGGETRSLLIERITDGAVRQIEARALEAGLYGPVPAEPRLNNAGPAAVHGPPRLVWLDIAHRDDTVPAYQPYLAVHADPWPGTVALWHQSSDGGSYRLIASHDRRSTIGTTVSVVSPGPLARWDRNSRIEVRIEAGHLVSLSEPDVLAGGNLAAVQNVAGAWEVFQFATATLTGPQTYALTGLLRGQGGSEDAWEAAIPIGSAFVLLDDALLAVPIARDDLGLALQFRLGPQRDDYTAASYSAIAATPLGRALLPWSPTDLQARRDAVTGAVLFSWIRRSRVTGADVWGAGDAPLGEDTEAYRLKILNGSTVVRQVDVATAQFTYGAAEQIADFGVAQAAYTIAVAQLSTALGPGLWRKAELAV